MNKTAVKNFAIWARNKLISDIRYKAGLMGITEKGIDYPLPQSTQSVQFFDIGTKEPYAISGIEIDQRRKLVDLIKSKEEESDYETALKYVTEEVAYTWFNRLIAIRFMEVNDYLPTRIRVLSSESDNKMEPDIVTYALDIELGYSATERERIVQLKFDSKLNDLFRMLFVKQCNALNDNLPELFEKTSDYTELLFNVSFTDKDGVVYHLVNDIPEDDFNVSKEGQIEIIGWLYQYYNTEPKDETFALLKKNVKITKERIPSATQLFTPEWIVKYMVENSLGRLWVEGHQNEELKATWKYYLEEADQEEEVLRELEKIREEYKTLKPEDIRVIDPAMGSGHILVYSFDVLIQIYESAGYTRRDAARLIVEKNLYGLDIDNRAYQLAYFAVMMKARQYNRRILDKNEEVKCNLHVIQESNGINRNQLKYFGSHLSNMEKNTALLEIEDLLDTFIDAKEYGSILKVNNYNWKLLNDFASDFDGGNQQSFDLVGIDETKEKLKVLTKIAEILSSKYDIVITNPPYMGSSGMGAKLSEYVKINYTDSKSDLFSVFITKCNILTITDGFQAMITQHSWMFLSDYRKVRNSILSNNFIVNMIHLGSRAFDEIPGEVVQTTSFIVSKKVMKEYNGSYVRLTDYSGEYSKKSAYLKNSPSDKYAMNMIQISAFPDSILAYWVSKKLLSLFENGDKLAQYGQAKQGLATTDNKKFLRLWHEIDINNISFNTKDVEETLTKKYKWYPYNKGGRFRRWSSIDEYVVNYQMNGQEIKESVLSKYDYLKTPDFVVKNTSSYFRKGITWNDVSTNDFCARFVNEGYIFDAAGPMYFCDDDLLMLGYFNSKVFQIFADVICQGLHYSTGHIPLIPYKQVQDSNMVHRLVRENLAITKENWDSYEVSWDFAKHPLINTISIKSAYENWCEVVGNSRSILIENEVSLNRIFIKEFDLDDEIKPDIKESNVSIQQINLKQNISSFLSYAVGCIFGRYSLDAKGLIYAGGKWDDSDFKTFIPNKDNNLLITDEGYLKDDIVGRFVEFVKVVYGTETLEDNLDFIANALGNKGNSSREVIRNYFMKDFFKDHCKTYQKRPIYWLFDSGKQNGFKALVYMHRYDEDTIGDLRIDYLHKTQRIYENEIKRMQEIIENSTDARESSVAIKRKDKLLKQLQETKDYDEKIAHLALARTSIDLDDGVKVNYEKVQTDKEGKKLDVLAKI